ncbi:MAG: uroporphyrinogen-III synthase [Luteibaculaceae bacterium]
MKIKSILVSQPEPVNKKDPYFELAEKYKIKIDFRKFIQVDPVPVMEFRAQKVNILEHDAVVLTSRNAIDHFFHLCKELRVTVPDDFKYFCVSEAIALYLQRYVVYRKRKIFFGDGKLEDLTDSFKKFKKDKYLFPCTDIHKANMTDLLDEMGIAYTKAIMYRTVASDLSDLKDVNYDMLVFFSPGGIESLFKNFPDFKQNNTKIAAFGATTAKAVEEHGLKIDLSAPTVEAPSMPAAIEYYIKNMK